MPVLPKRTEVKITSAESLGFLQFNSTNVLLLQCTFNDMLITHLNRHHSNCALSLLQAHYRHLTEKGRLGTSVSWISWVHVFEVKELLIFFLLSCLFSSCFSFVFNVLSCLDLFLFCFSMPLYNKGLWKQEHPRKFGFHLQNLRVVEGVSSRSHPYGTCEQTVKV